VCIIFIVSLFTVIAVFVVFVPRIRNMLSFLSLFRVSHIFIPAPSYKDNPFYLYPSSSTTTMRLPVALCLPPRRRLHQDRNGCKDANSSKHPRNNLNNLQLMTLSQATSNMSDTLVTENHTPHRMHQHARYDPQDS